MRRLPEPDPGLPDSRSAARFLFWLVRRTRLTVIVAAVLAIIWMGCQSLAPAMVGQAVDAAVDKDGRRLAGWTLLMLGIGAIQVITGVMRYRFAVTNWLGAAFRTVQVVVRQANRLGATLPRRLDTGDVVAIGTSDIGHIGGAVDILSRGIGSLLAVTTITVLLLRISAPLGMIVLLGVPFMMLVVGLLIGPLHRRQRAYRRLQGRVTSQTADLVSGLRVLRGVGGEPIMAARYRAASQQLRFAGVRTAKVEALLEAAQVLLPGVFLILLTWLGARFAWAGRITVGQLVSFYAYAAFLVTPLRQLTDAVDKITRGHVSSRRVARMLTVDRELSEPAEPVPLAGGELADLESGVVVPPDRLTAIVTAVPAEAARIADRLGRYVDGATLGGVPLCGASLADVRERILVVENDARLFAGPLMSDLDPHGTGTLPEALEVADATGIVGALPDGVTSVVSERGRSFSGGQQQRLRLARALVENPDILILVEPTNAVDAHTEAVIADRLRAARSGRTTVICTSSPLLLTRTDHVCYVENGLLVAAGPHHVLLRTQPRYARMVLREEQQ
jgi:ABC-type multidrug transport system fused ATPase/permease subunit